VTNKESIPDNLRQLDIFTTEVLKRLWKGMLKMGLSQWSFFDIRFLSASLPLSWRIINITSTHYNFIFLSLHSSVGSGYQPQLIRSSLRSPYPGLCYSPVADPMISLFCKQRCSR